MDRRIAAARWLLLAWLPWVTACGGSGSSGLDIVAAENIAIEWSMREMTCVPDEVYRKPYCPMGVPVPPPPPPGQPTPSPVDPTKTVLVELANGTAIECVRSAAGRCRIELEFTAVGFELGGERFYLAATTRPRAGDWQLATEPATPTDEADRFVAVVEVKLPDQAATEELSVQVAVLAVSATVQPPGSEAVVLSETDADAIYVDGERPLFPAGDPPVEPTPSPTPEATPSGAPATPEPEPTPAATPSGEESPAPAPSDSPEPSGNPALTPTPGPVETPAPTPDPGATERPQGTPVPTETPPPEATPSPVHPELAPTGEEPTPEPSDEPTPVPTPEEPEVTRTPGDPQPTPAEPTPVASETPEPAPTPVATAPPTPTEPETEPPPTPLRSPAPSPIETLDPIEGLNPVRPAPPGPINGGGGRR